MTNNPTDDSRPWSVFLIFLRLGLTSFGGPIAHLGYFRAELSYADLVALCQFLPGPASSQVGIAVGLSRAGYSGALAAWAGFTLPSAIALILFALGISSYGDYVSQGALHGLKVVAVAVVAQAVWGMARNLCTDGLRVTIMAIATCVVLLVPSAWGQVGVIAIAGIAGRLLFKPAKVVEHDPLPITVSHRAGVLWLSLFFVLLIGLPVLAELMPSQTMAMVDSFYRVGLLVFGGGHVVLPLLQAEVVPSGGARPFVHVRRVSWCLDEHRPVGLDRRHCVSAGYLRALVLAGRRINAILGAFAPQYRHPSCAGRDQCRCSRLAAGRAVSACMD